MCNHVNNVIAYLNEYAENNDHIIVEEPRIKSMDLTIKVKTGRVTIMNDLMKKLTNLNYNVSHTIKGSSIGRLIIHLDHYNINLYVKPKSFNKGIKNEHDFFDIVSGFKGDIVFNSGDNKVEYKNIEDIEFAPPPNKNRITHRKADVYLIDKNGDKFPISLKSDGNTQWESADGTLRPMVKDAIREIMDAHDLDTFESSKLKCDITLPIDENLVINNKVISPKYFVFGEDIEDKGCIAIQSYAKPNSYHVDGNKMVFHSTHVFDKWEQIENSQSHKPYIIVRKDRTRNVNDELMSGLRSLVTPHYRVKRAKTPAQLCKTKLEEFYHD